MDIRIGFDLDGTLSPVWWKEGEGIFKKDRKNIIKHYKWNYFCIKQLPLMYPTTDSIIITNRPYHIFKESTEDWVILNNLNVSIVCMAPCIIDDIEQIVLNKARHIKNHYLDEYYEDNILIRNKLSLVCKRTKILPPIEAIYRGRAKNNEIQFGNKHHYLNGITM